MLVRERKSFALGLVMAITFLAVFAFLFTPSFNGRNAFEAADRLFNSIAKGSTYHIPGLIESSQDFRGTLLQTPLKLEEAEDNARTVLASNGVTLTDGQEMSADLGSTLIAALEDSDAMFHNRGGEIASRYGLEEKQVLHSWWQILKALERSLQSQGQFKEAAFVAEVNTRGIEVAYNFYGIEPQKATTKAGILTFSLIFYVVYTLWWGYAIYFLAQGLGLQLKAGAKKEV